MIGYGAPWYAWIGYIALSAYSLYLISRHADKD